MLEKLFYDILTYSYLLLPLTAVFFTHRYNRIDSIIIGGYGILFCILLYTIDNGYIPNNYVKAHQALYTLSEYSFFSYYLFKNITIKPFRIIILFFSVLFFLFVAYNYYWSGEVKLDSIPVGIETILLFIYISFYFYQSFQNTASGYIYTSDCFWVALGILIYLGGTFFFNILVNHLAQPDVDKYWFLTYIAESVKNLLLCVSIIIADRSSQKVHFHQKTVPYLDLDIN